jgi:transcriptional regulator with XRE-family HTH domain
MERIRQLRTERGLSQAKLAVRADMDPATLNRLEQGKGNPNLRTLERVADALGVEVADLLGKGEAPPPAQQSFNGLLEEERRTREPERIALVGRALHELWRAEVQRGEFDRAAYERTGQAWEALDAALGDTTAEYEGGSPGYRSAWNRAWQATDDLLRELQRAYRELEARGVTDINDYRSRHAGVGRDQRSA